MKSFYFSILMALGFFFAMPTFAQTEKTMIVHFKDNTIKEIPVSQIDSINFVKPESVQNFDVQLGDMHSLYVEYTIGPANGFNGTYNVMMVEKSEFDKYENDEAVLADDLKFFKELAAGSGLTLQEIIESFVIKGVFEDVNTALMPDTEYVMWAYGMNVDGTITTPLQKVIFKTNPATRIENKIKIDVKRTAGQLEATYIPDDNNLHYTAGLFSAQDALSAAFIPTKLQRSISEMVGEYIMGDETLQDYLDSQTELGKSTGVFQGADASSKYYIVAAYLDNECCVCSDVAIVASDAAGNTKSVSSTADYLKEKTSVKRHVSNKFQIKDQIYRLSK